MMGGFGVFGIGMLLMVLFWCAIIGGAIWLVAMLARGNRGASTAGNGNGLAPASQTPLDILNARYARGEINKEQYEGIKRDLGNQER